MVFNMNINFKINVDKKFKLNGKEYNSLDEMPNDVRVKFENILKDTGNKAYKSMDDVPEDIKEKVKQALNTNVSNVSPESPFFAFTQPFTFENRAARFLNNLSFFVFIWAFFFSSILNGLAMLACCLLPLSAIYIFVRSKGTIWFNPLNKESSQHSGFAFILPTTALFIRTIWDSHIVSFKHVINPLIIMFFLIGYLVYFCSIKYDIKAKSALLAVLFLLPFCYGLVIQANRLLDTSEPAHYTARVLNKFHSYQIESVFDYLGAYYSGYELFLSPWGDIKRETKVTVKKSFYDKINKDADVHITLRKGLLGIPWYTLKKPDIKL